MFSMVRVRPSFHLDYLVSQLANGTTNKNGISLSIYLGDPVPKVDASNPAKQSCYYFEVPSSVVMNS